MKLERVYEPSRIRRGRPSTVPTWYATTADGQRFRFLTKRLALAFMQNGGCTAHTEGVFGCGACGGRESSGQVER